MVWSTFDPRLRQSNQIEPIRQHLDLLQQNVTQSPVILPQPHANPAVGDLTGTRNNAAATRTEADVAKKHGEQTPRAQKKEG